MDPRPTYHDFAHTLIPSEAHHDPETTWAALAGNQPDAWLNDQWCMAGGMLDGPNPPRLAGQHSLDGGAWDVMLIEPPPPEASTEAWWIALVRRPDHPRDVGCFVVERTETGGGRLIEWRPGPVSIDGPTLDTTSQAMLEHLSQSLADRPFPAFAGLKKATHPFLVAPPSPSQKTTPTAPNHHEAHPSPLQSSRTLMVLITLAVALSAALIAFGMMLD